jgi:methyl-CpG-binding domain protein 4
VDTPTRRSPLGLIQEDLRWEPWRLLVACMCLNQTSIRQVRPVIWTFFATWPEPEQAASAPQGEMAAMLQSLGLQNRRSGLIIRMSRAFLDWLPSQDVRELPGVGKYAADSYNTFIRGDLAEGATDKELMKYVSWALGVQSCTDEVS